MARADDMTDGDAALAATGAAPTLQAPDAATLLAAPLARGDAAPTLQAPDAATLLAAGVAARPRDADAEIERGTLVGRYVVLTRLGLGGMGVVYAGYDPELDRKVALKLLRAAVGEGTAASVGGARLLREAQALARLSHPNVVAVHDVGTLGDRVWLAMEYVDGMTLGTWLKEHSPGWRDVLEVMHAVGRGLVAAHAAGLIHRDLKPDNIMVGRDGRVRVMDFGLARAAGPRDPGAPRPAAGERTSLSLDVTQAGAVMGTPAYMAPEQWRGDPVDAAADQFAFCVTLWEALYGARPFEAEGLPALAAAVTAGQVRPPPRRARVPAWLRRVLLRGLQPDPQRRFPSMDALLHALARARSRVRLVRTAVALGLAAALAAAVPVWQRHDHARRLAACEATGDAIATEWNDDARAALHDALRATGLNYAESTFARAVPWIDRWTADWAKTRVAICREADVARTLPAELHARALACLDERREELAALLATLREDAATAALRAVMAAAGLSSPAPCADRAALERRPEPPADPAARARVVELRRDMMRAHGLYAAGRFAEGLDRAEALLAEAERVAYAPLVAEAGVLVGTLAEKAQQLDRAEAALVRAFVDAGSIAADDVAVDAAIELVVLKGYDQAKFEAGIDWSHAAEMLVRRLGRSDDVLGGRFANARALVYKRRGEHDRAHALYQRALAIRERELGADHPEVALLLNNIANLEQARGNFDSTLVLFQRALTNLERAFGPDHPHVASVLNNFGAAHYYRGHHDEALALWDRALAIREPIDGPEHPLVLDILGNKANVLTDRGQHDEALALQQRVLAALEQQYEPGHPKIADAIGNIALIHRRQRDLDAAVAAEERALAIREAAFGPDHLDVAHSLANLGVIHLIRHDHERALALLQRALAIREKALDPDSAELADALAGVGEAHLARGALDQAEPFIARALAIQEKILVADHPNLATSRHLLARVRLRQGDLDAAQALEEQALATWDRHPELGLQRAFTLSSLGEIAHARGRPADAVARLEQALAHVPEGPRFALALAEIRFALAQALADAPADATGPAGETGPVRDLARARRLATQAAAAYRAAGEPSRKQLAEVQTWLKRHPD